MMTRDGITNLLRTIANMGEQHKILNTALRIERCRDGQYHVNANVKYEDGDEVKWLLISTDSVGQKCDA